MTYVLCLSFAVMASIELYGNPLAEEIEIDRLISLCPVQPKDVNFKVTTVLVSGKLKNLKFQQTWYDERPWLEYSSEEDKACCFYCRLFKPLVYSKSTRTVPSVML